jgi:hypothetical protein
VLHCEVALTMESWLVDEDIFFVASSRAAAERLIRSTWVEPGSWWRVESARLDDIEGTRADDRLKTLYYSRSGELIPSPPKAKGYKAAIRRETHAAKTIQSRLREASTAGLSKQTVRNLEGSLRSLRRILARHK